MSNSRNTKRSFITSILAMVTCLTMLIGTTFAWFTDTASTAVNKIQSGTLKVDIQNKDNESLDGNTLEWQAKDGRAQEQCSLRNLLPFRLLLHGQQDHGQPLSFPLFLCQPQTGV